ncbi:type II toxin-antitoxin system PemK/MazF family toxin [Luteococcus sp. H138]|uniref:type II toxin-antitoxin system PemK/MazF family toxin n=1 Tax=unclassified Luteococcus TaxID=2639923 RepID=UPI00313DBE04
MAFSWKSLLTDVARGLLREGVRSLDQGQRQGRQNRQPSRPSVSTDYPGDFTGSPQISYSPRAGETPDPGEVVWAWVPYEEDHAQGKDRPVLLLGRDGDWLIALPLTSKDHDRDAAQETSQGRHWTDVGTGAWDPQGRPSEARVDRIVRVAPGSVRRTGAALDREVFDRVADAVRERANG